MKPSTDHSSGPWPWPLDDAAVRLAMEGMIVDGSWGRYHGPHCGALSEALSGRHNRRWVELCCSGTVAVELALRGLGVGPGDEVILAAYDFAGNLLWKVVLDREETALVGPTARSPPGSPRTFRRRGPRETHQRGRLQGR